jgi:hypothetical protein
VRVDWIGAFVAAAAAVTAGWVVAVVALLAAGVRGWLVVVRAGLTAVAVAAGGRLDFTGPLLADQRGATITGRPLTLTAVAGVVVGAVLVRRSRRLVAPRGAGTLVGAAAAVLLALFTAVAARLGRYAGATPGGAPLRFAAPVVSAAVGGLVLGGIAAAAATTIAAGALDRLPPAYRRWLPSARGALGGLAAVAAVGLAGALVLVGYTGGDAGIGRIAIELLAAPNVAILLVVVALGVPIVASVSATGILADLPLIGAHAGGGLHTSLTLADLLDRNAAYLLLPVAVAVALAAAGCWTALRSPAGSRTRAVAAMAAVFAVAALVGAQLSRLAVELHGGFLTPSLAGSVRPRAAVAVVVAGGWAAIAGAVGAAAVARFGEQRSSRLRRTLHVVDPDEECSVEAAEPAARAGDDAPYDMLDSNDR